MSEYITQDYEQIPYQVAELNKQIVLLKQENEELKKDNEYWKCNFDKEALVVQEIEDENDDLKIENDELKKFKEESKKAFSNLMEMYNDNCDFTGVCEQKLEKIKEIIEEDCKSCAYKTECSYCSNTKILQIIEE